MSNLSNNPNDSDLTVSQTTLSNLPASDNSSNSVSNNSVPSVGDENVSSVIKETVSSADTSAQVDGAVQTADASAQVDGAVQTAESIDLDAKWSRWKCMVCGYTYEGRSAILKCPKCGNEDPDKFGDE